MPEVVPEQQTPESVEADPATDDQPELAILPIDQRKPDDPLNAQQRRARAYENIEVISKALQAYYRKNKIYPRSYSTTSSGIPALSWRFEILPYLGYQDLYDRFDLTQPWNREPNESLLQYIPKEFVSPERFDTNTNYLVPAHRLFMFADNKRRADHNVDDGVHNTIMLLEINDELAVPWTKPSDYVAADPQHITLETATLVEITSDMANYRLQSYDGVSFVRASEAFDERCWGCGRLACSGSCLSHTPC